MMMAWNRAVAVEMRQVVGVVRTFLGYKRKGPDGRERSQ